MKRNVTAGLLLGLVCSLPSLAGAQASTGRPDNQVMKLTGGNGPVVKSIQLESGVSLQYAEQGKTGAVPVIFLHGITDSWHSFESIMPFLPARIHAFALTQRGHGDSERPKEGYLTRDFAADVAAFIRQKKLGSAFIVGHSMGGINTLKFAIDYPELTRGIVIIDSDPDFSDNPGMPEFVSEVNKLEGAIDYKFMDDFQKATLAKPIDSNYFRLLVNEGVKTPAWVFKAALNGLLGGVTKDLGKIKAPVLLFWGSQDAFCFRADQELMLQRIKQAKLIVYEGTGHALHWEEPARFSADLVKFIDKHNP